MEPMLIRIGEKKDQVICGKIWHASLEKPVEFMGVGQLIIRMEEICELEGLVPAKEEPRFLNSQMQQKYQMEQERKRLHRAASEPLSFWDDKELQGGKTRVLLVADIRSRDHYSMQGMVRGPMTNGKYVNFRSALELMRMIALIDI